jgi:two-component system nitrogen regulation sensor histidine kinase GlnL
VTCRPLRDGLRIEVGDEGLGVPPELRDTLFEPYVSGRPGGTGLGLSIARRIALDHGFELRYESNHPRGTLLLVEVKGS